MHRRWWRRNCAWPASGWRQAHLLRLTPSEQRSFSVEFAALDYSGPEHLRYRYRLQGFDAGWIDTGADFRVASYGNLPPGDYVLEVQGSNRTGQWSPQTLNLPVQVLPAWWQTWWARVLGVLAGLLALLMPAWCSCARPCCVASSQCWNCRASAASAPRRWRCCRVSCRSKSAALEASAASPTR
jgi:hypothetical protein